MFLLPSTSQQKSSLFLQTCFYSHTQRKHPYIFSWRTKRCRGINFIFLVIALDQKNNNMQSLCFGGSTDMKNHLQILLETYLHGEKWRCSVVHRLDYESGPRHDKTVHCYGKPFAYTATPFPFLRVCNLYLFSYIMLGLTHTIKSTRR